MQFKCENVNINLSVSDVCLIYVTVCHVISDVYTGVSDCDLFVGFLCYVLQPQWQQYCPEIMKPPQSLPLHMAEHLLRAQPDSVAIHVTDCSISDRRALT